MYGDTHWFKHDNLSWLPRDRLFGSATSGAIALSAPGNVTVNINCRSRVNEPTGGYFIENIGFRMVGNGGTSASQNFQLTGFSVSLQDSGGNELFPIGDSKANNTGAVHEVTIYQSHDLLLSFTDLSTLILINGTASMGLPLRVNFIVSFLNSDTVGTLTVLLQAFVLMREFRGIYGGD